MPVLGSVPIYLSSFPPAPITKLRRWVRLPSHGASAVRIHGIGPGEILTPTLIEYIAATEVEDSTRREAARAIERIQAHLVLPSRERRDPAPPLPDEAYYRCLLKPRSSLPGAPGKD